MGFETVLLNPMRDYEHSARQIDDGDNRREQVC